MRPKSNNLSIMITDIQGYTDTSVKSTRQDILDLIRRHKKLLMPVIDFYHGTLIKTMGDAFLCTFTSATDAVTCAIVIQRILHEYNQYQREPNKKLHLRIVVNTGDVTIEDNDIYGDAVNITARMEGLECFSGDTIGISEATYLLMNRNEISATKIGPFELKGIPDPVVVYEVPLENQTLDKVPARILELVEKVRSVADKGEDSEHHEEWEGIFVNGVKVSERSLRDDGGEMGEEDDDDHDGVHIDSLDISEERKEQIRNVARQRMHTGDYTNSFVTAGALLGLVAGRIIGPTAPFLMIGIGAGFLVPWLLSLIMKGIGSSRSLFGGSFLMVWGIYGLLSGDMGTGLLLGVAVAFMADMINKIATRKL